MSMWKVKISLKECNIENRKCKERESVYTYRGNCIFDGTSVIIKKYQFK